MHKLQDSVFSILKTTDLSPAVYSYLRSAENSTDETPLGGILDDTCHGWLALGPKFCVIDLKTGLKIAAKTFGAPYSKSRTSVTSVVELPDPLTENSKQLVISVCDDITSTIYVFHINGSLTLRCIQTDLIVTELTVCGMLPDGPFTCFDGIVMAGTLSGEVFVFDLNRDGLIQAIKDISQGYEDLIQNESNPATLTFLPLDAILHIEEQRDLAMENSEHLAVMLNETSLTDSQFIFHNPDGSVRLTAKKEHIRVTVLQYIPQLASLIVGYNFGAFQIWNVLTLELEYTSQVNVENVPVSHFGFQEPCDDPRAFCYLWVVYSTIDRLEDEEFPFAVMYSLTYNGKRMLSDTKCIYQELSMASVRFQVELSGMEDARDLVGGKCISCHTYTINTTLGNEGEDSMLNICQLIWECWGDSPYTPPQYGMLVFDLDQWYKDQMPETHRLQSNAFMSATWWPELSGGGLVAGRLQPASVAPYAHATRLEEHFYPNSLQYRCVCLTTSQALVLSTVGIQRQIISSLDSEGPTALLNPTRLYLACLSAGLTPLYTYHGTASRNQEEQRRFLLSVALEARLARFLKRCAHDWATGTHVGAGCTLQFLVDWCWQRALELKENAKELTAPLFSSSSLPDRNVVRCLEHCVQQLTQLTSLLDAVLTKCCNLVVPDALSEMEEKYKGIGTVSLYFQVVQWFVRVGLLPERHPAAPYPRPQLAARYANRRLKLQRLEQDAPVGETPTKPCSLLYIDQLIENEFGGERIYEMWRKGGSECNGLYPPPSLYSLLRLYLLSDVAAERKHELVLYLLVDYSILYDHVRHETVIRRLMQFPTMFGLSNTAIKATQAFWHLDHRDFDFALDQLQCLTGNTLSEWQHNVVLSSLLAQKKTQAALQYLHVRKPPPVQIKDSNGVSNSRMNDHDKLDDWQPCCNLYLARGLVFEALDVIRVVIQNADRLSDKEQVLNFFFKGCRSTGQLAKLMQVTLSPFEEEFFIKYLQDCNDPQTSDLLVMFYLQQARYFEAEQYNNKLKRDKNRVKESLGSAESLADVMDRESARDAVVELACASLPAVANSVRDVVFSEKDVEPRVITPKPLSVFVQANSPKNKFMYKSTFIQDTIENASETWVNKPKMRKGLKRALNIEETPFICTPKLMRTTSLFNDNPSESTPPKRVKLNFNSTPKTPKFGSASKFSANLSKQMSALLDMPEVQSPDNNLYIERSGAETPHSILKIRRSEMDRDAPSPVDSRYLDDSEDDLLETESNHTQFSDSTNKHLRFTIPAAPVSGSTPITAPSQADMLRELYSTKIETDNQHITTSTHAIDEAHPLESPPKKQATETSVNTRRSYKDSVRARHSLSANSSLSDDPNTSIESIADIPITLINPRYSGESKKSTKQRTESVIESAIEEEKESVQLVIPNTPTGRKGIRNASKESTPIKNRSRSRTPEKIDKGVIESPKLAVISESPIKTPTDSSPSRRSLRSRSRTPEVEVPQELTTPSSPRSLRSRAKTPDKIMSPKKEHNAKNKKMPLSRIVLEANAFAKSKGNTEQIEPTSTETDTAIECTPMKSIKQVPSLMDVTLSPIVNKSVLQSSSDSVLSESVEKGLGKSDDKSFTDLGLKPLPAFTTIHETYYEKSVLRSYQSSVADSSGSIQEKSEVKTYESTVSNKPIKTLPAFNTIQDAEMKSVLHSYESSVGETLDTDSFREEKQSKATDGIFKPFTTISDSIETSVLKSHQSSVAESSQDTKDTEGALKNVSLITNDSDLEEKGVQGWKSTIDSQDTAAVIQKEKEKIVDIEREINELEGDMTDDESGAERTSSGDEEIIEAEDSDTAAEEEESTSSEEKSEDEEGSDEEIISIQDTDSDDTSHSDNVPRKSDNAGVETQVDEKNVESQDIQVDTTEVVEQKETLAQTSILTNDNSLAESDKSDVNLNYSDENKSGADDVQPNTDDAMDVETTDRVAMVEDFTIKSGNDETLNINSVDVPDSIKEAEITSEVQPTTEKRSKRNKQDEKKVEKSIEIETKETRNESSYDTEEKEIKESTDEDTVKKPGSRTKRSSSTSSKKSTTDTQDDVIRTPTTRKRTKSIASKSDIDLKAAETEGNTPQIAVTPKKTEVRKIITRRASKEIEKIDESQEILDESINVTPSRRSARSKSKNTDDTESVVSESSLKTSRSKESEVTSDVKPMKVRKGRKSISTKPDLSVIPETTVEEDTNVADGIIQEYSTSRRLTRQQKSLLESWLTTPQPSSAVDEPSTSGIDTTILQPADKARLLAKLEYEGSSDTEEVRTGSPDSFASDLSKQRKSRLTRAASESKTTPKTVKSIRRMSVDVAESPEPGSPATLRSRRASFNKACEALNTPKSRRTSTDTRKDTDSPRASPAPSDESPARRSRRVSSTHSNTSQTKSDAKRTKKSSTSEENKDSKKK